MKCVAEVRCQARDDNGKIRTFSAGQVFEFVECPPNFRPVAGETEDAKPIDFTKATREELMAAKWKASDAIDVIKAEFDVDIPYEKGLTKKSELVEKILEARFRHVGEVDLDHTR